MLGLLPGSGGTQRLPRLVGIQEAVSLMTTGKTLSADRAKKAGLIHEVVDPAALETVALQAARELIAGSLKPSKRKPSIFSWLLEGNPLGRMVLWNQAEKAINKAAGGHYPAPLAILEVSIGGGARCKLAMLSPSLNFFCCSLSRPESSKGTQRARRLRRGYLVS
jgi:3-hydroxyacyl-CoA dehydrogenase/enoyl-CoA hydratase/3-hydroxybutyryl-CoA epimerase